MTNKIQRPSSSVANLSDNEFAQDLKKTAIYFLGTFLYIRVLIKTNFITATIIFNFAAMFLLCKPKPIMARLWITIVSCSVTVVSIYYIFTKIFYVVLP